MGNAMSKRFNALMLSVSVSRSSIRFKKERFVHKPNACSRGAHAMGSFIGYSVRPEGSSGSHLDPTDGSGSLHAQLVPEVESARNTNEDAIAVKWMSSPSRSL